MTLYKTEKNSSKYLPGWSDSTIMQVERLERSGTFAQQSVE